MTYKYRPYIKNTTMLTCMHLCREHLKYFLYILFALLNYKKIFNVSIYYARIYSEYVFIK